MKVCDCDAGNGNLGIPNCIPVFGIGRNKIFVALIDSDGNRNFIDPAVEITTAFIIGKLNESDVTKRWFLTPPYENGTSVRADSEFEEFSSGAREKLRTGIRTEEFLFPKKSTIFLKKISANQCVQNGEFTISDNGSIRGIGGADGFLYPVAIQAYDTNWNPQLDDATEKVMVKYDYKRKVDDEDIRFIASSEFSGEFADHQGLLDVEGTLTVAVALSFTMVMRLSYASLGAEILHTGVLLADSVSLTNLTTETAMTIVSITEVTDGVYDVVYTGASTGGDILQWIISKEKFDYAGVASVEITFV